jgi:hypothetical protein
VSFTARGALIRKGAEAAAHIEYRARQFRQSHDPQAGTFLQACMAAVERAVQASDHAVQ